MSIVPFPWRRNNGQHWWIGNAPDPSQLLTHYGFFCPQLLRIRDLLPGAPTTLRHIGTRRLAAMRRGVPKSEELTSGIGLFLLAESDLYFIPRYGSRDKHDFSI